MVRRCTVILLAVLLLVASGCSVEKPVAQESKPKPIETLDEAMAHVGHRVKVCYKGGVYVTAQGRLWYVRGAEGVRVDIPEISRNVFTEIEEVYAQKANAYFYAGTESCYVDCGSNGLWHLDGAVATKVQEKSKLSPDSAKAFSASPTERRVLSFLGPQVEENRNHIASLQDRIGPADYLPPE